MPRKRYLVGLRQFEIKIMESSYVFHAEFAPNFLGVFVIFIANVAHVELTIKKLPGEGAGFPRTYHKLSCTQMDKLLSL